MTDDVADPPRRKPREKRAARTDDGKKIVVRVTDKEWEQLRLEAGNISLSAYVRARVFSGGVRSRDGLQLIAALHVAGRGLQLSASDPAADPAAVADALVQVRVAIARLASNIPVAADEVAAAP